MFDFSWCAIWRRRTHNRNILGTFLFSWSNNSERKVWKWVNSRLVFYLGVNLNEHNKITSKELYMELQTCFVCFWKYFKEKYCMKVTNHKIIQLNLIVRKHIHQTYCQNTVTIQRFQFVSFSFFISPQHNLKKVWLLD